MRAKQLEERMDRVEETSLQGVKEAARQLRLQWDKEIVQVNEKLERLNEMVMSELEPKFESLRIDLYKLSIRKTYFF
jgi:hypothetical protein